ncbi:hypothetical protein MKW98_029402 [Papaver atlanticum]|uniref:Uncharacterized protein n=1 Tax=Papaver atlanticum TaxID=357466 RepID=A0AAD4SIE3_9MAGN|nr:hypothetical protein MKW98_029402 [Papaver atlanticum]
MSIKGSSSVGFLKHDGSLGEETKISALISHQHHYILKHPPDYADVKHSPLQERDVLSSRSCIYKIVKYQFR